VVLKLIKINFLLKFYKTFEFYEDPRFISEISRAYRYLFIANLDFKITEIIMKRIILLIYKTNFYSTFLLAKNSFMILRDLSNNPENYALIKQKSEYFKITFNYLFEKINYNNLDLLSYKELGFIIYMVSETQLGTEENYRMLNNYVINNLGNSMISRKISYQMVKAFYKFLNFILIGFCSNLDIYDYSASELLIIDLLRNCESLPYRYLLNFSMSFFKLKHENEYIWILLFKHFTLFATQNPGNFPYSIKFVIDYSAYIKRKRSELDQINQAFINFYLEKLIEIYSKNYSGIDKLFNTSHQKSKDIELASDENENDNEFVEKEIIAKTSEEVKEDAEDISKSKLKIELKKISADLDNSEKSNNNPLSQENIEKPDYEEIISKGKSNKQEDSHDFNKEEVKIVYEKVYKSIIKREIILKETLINSPDHIFKDIKSAINFILKKCEKFNINSVGFIHNKIISDLILLKIKYNFIDDWMEFSYFYAFDLNNIDEYSLKNIKEILKIINFDSIPNFKDFVIEQIFNSKDKILLDKFLSYVQDELQIFKDNKYKFSNAGLEEIYNKFKIYNLIIQKYTSDKDINLLNENLTNEINSFIF